MIIGFSPYLLLYACVKNDKFKMRFTESIVASSDWTIRLLLNDSDSHHI